MPFTSTFTRCRALPVQITPRVLARTRTHHLRRQPIRKLSSTLPRFGAQDKPFSSPVDFIGHVHAPEAGRSRTCLHGGRVACVCAAEADGFVFEVDGREVGVAGVVDYDGGAGAVWLTGRESIRDLARGEGSSVPVETAEGIVVRASRGNDVRPGLGMALHLRVCPAHQLSCL